MIPKIDETMFGSITLKGEKTNHDVIIRMNGDVLKRKKKLSKMLYGTSHIVSLEEIKHVYEKGAKKLIVGSGQYNQLQLSAEAVEFLKEHKCDVKVLATPDAAGVWNKEKGAVIGMFHVTC
jgi:hypothetical protein